ncbi:MAG: hypothetical protein QMC07_02460 [Flavobacteriaceae bacterium]|jgi:hypothetical protein|tara:strand:- start:60 stop:641 length:582 start_codon:yes stop_codon:yes gene_type:complete
MKSFYLFIFSLFITITTFSQEIKKDTLSILNQFDKVYRKSSSYQEYKVIRKITFQNLKNNVVNTIEGIDKELISKNKKNKILKDSIQSINKNLIALESDLSLINIEKNSIYFFGLEIEKSSYKIIIMSTIILLIIMLSYFIYQFKSSYRITSLAKENLLEVENELAIYKKKSLEREQKLRRQLQDEVNKQRGV